MCLDKQINSWLQQRWAHSSQGIITSAQQYDIVNFASIQIIQRVIVWFQKGLLSQDFVFDESASRFIISVEKLTSKYRSIFYNVK